MNDAKIHNIFRGAKHNNFKTCLASPQIEMLTVMFPTWAGYLSCSPRCRWAISWKPPTLILRTPSALTAPSTTGITWTVWKPWGPIQ